MKEKLYAIPVNDGFDADCECPICRMKKTLEDSAVEYTMGPSYMEEDTRALTDAMGFCEKHAKAVCNQENRLGMALVLKTHFDKVICDIQAMEVFPAKAKGFFKKEARTQTAVTEYVQKLQKSCFVCSRVEAVFDRYVDTVFYLWKNDEQFKEKFLHGRGFCTEHYGLLHERAPGQLTGAALAAFTEALNRLYIDNMKRVRDDLEWFINKFDYKYANAPWKNSRDSIPRALTKTNGIIEEKKENG